MAQLALAKAQSERLLNLILSHSSGISLTNRNMLGTQTEYTLPEINKYPPILPFN